MVCLLVELGLDVEQKRLVQSFERLNLRIIPVPKCEVNSSPYDIYQNYLPSTVFSRKRARTFQIPTQIPRNPDSINRSAIQITRNTIQIARNLVQITRNTVQITRRAVQIARSTVQIT